MLQRRHRRVEALCVHCGVTWVCCSVDLMVDEAAIWSPHVRPGGRLGLVGERAGQPGRVWLKFHIGPSGVPWGVFVSKSSCWDPPHRDPPRLEGVRLRFSRFLSWTLVWAASGAGFTLRPQVCRERLARALSPYFWWKPS